MTYTLERETFVPRPLREVFEFFSRAENLERITPPWLGFRFEAPPPPQLGKGSRIAYRLRIHGIPISWVTEIDVWNPPHEFIDVQAKGPYRLWRHSHRFRAVQGGTRMEDTVSYALPFGPLGRLVHALLVSRDVSAIFDYRERRIRELLGTTVD